MVKAEEEEAEEEEDEENNDFRESSTGVGTSAKVPGVS